MSDRVPVQPPIVQHGPQVVEAHRLAATVAGLLEQAQGPAEVPSCIHVAAERAQGHRRVHDGSRHAGLLTGVAVQVRSLLMVREPVTGAARTPVDDAELIKGGGLAPLVAERDVCGESLLRMVPGLIVIPDPAACGAYVQCRPGDAGRVAEKTAGLQCPLMGWDSITPVAAGEKESGQGMGQVGALPVLLVQAGMLSCQQYISPFCR